jgi:transposase
MGRGKGIKEQEIDIYELIENARQQIKNESNLSPGLKATIELLIGVCLLLAGKRLARNSKNSNMPPSADVNREKNRKGQGQRKPGGQSGHEGKTLLPVENPEKIETIKIDRKTLPAGNWKEDGYETRQVFHMSIKRQVIEYRAEIVVNEKGKRITAPFPEGVTQSAQYGGSVKAHAVYMSVHQMIPCERVSEHFESQIHIPLSSGSVCNFKEEASEKLEWFDEWVNGKLQKEAVLNCDETGINIEGNRVWLHSASSEKYTRYLDCTPFGRHD